MKISANAKFFVACGQQFVKYNSNHQTKSPPNLMLTKCTTPTVDEKCIILNFTIPHQEWLSKVH